MKYLIAVLFGFSFFLVACGQQTSTTQKKTTATTAAPTPSSAVPWIDIQPNSHIKWTKGVMFACPTGYHWIQVSTGTSASSSGTPMTCVSASATTTAMVDVATINDWQTPQPYSHIHWSNGSLMMCPSGTTPDISTANGTMTCK